MTRFMNSAREQLDENQDHSEGPIARTIENQTARLPSDTFLWLAGASIIGSLAFRIFGRKHDALFVGEWAPTFLILGLYNKIVKTHGSDSHSRDVME